MYFEQVCAMLNLTVIVLLLCIFKWVDGVTQVIVCESDSMILTCDPNQVILITGANFGRLQPSVCSKGKNITNLCKSSLAFSKMQRHCDNRESCRILATTENFGDECLGVTRYLTVYFKCEEVTYDYPPVEAENTVFENPDVVVSDGQHEDSTPSFSPDPTVLDIISTISSLKTTTPVTTKSSTIPPIMSRRCSCECSIHEIISDRNLVERVHVDFIKRSLAIDKKNLSSNKRKLTSVGDKRMSASVVGYVGVIILTFVFGVVIISDLFSHFTCTQNNMYKVSRRRKSRIMRAN